MTTELFIENYPADLTAELSALLTFSIDDVKDFAARSTAWSKTVVLPGTARNNKIFGHIFQVGQSNEYDSTSPNINYNFNASKSASCLMFQDNLQAFKGVVRLRKIILLKGTIEYEVVMWGELFSLNVALSGGLLEDLDFSAYDQTYNETNIVASWDNPGGSGLYYPLIDYGTYSEEKHDWDIRTFRPALYVKEYIDKMIEAAGFRYESDLFNTSRFKSLIIPHNQKILTSNTSLLLTAGRATNQTVISYATTNQAKMNFTSDTTTIFTPNGSPADKYDYNGADTINTILNFTLAYNFKTNMNTILLELRKNGVAIATKTLPNVGGVTLSSGWTDSINVTFATGDYFEFWATVSSALTDYSFVLTQSDVTVETAGVIPVEVAPGDTITVNDTIPKNVRQVDFLLSIVKLFNLYIYESPTDKNLLYIKPYVDFYSTDPSNAVDWTYKLNRSKATTVEPMSELTAKIYDFKFKSDTDYYNDLYRKRYGKGYGDYIFDSLYEFAQQTQSLELIFSATPLVGYSGEEKVFPTIFKIVGGIEEVTDSNIRIMQTKKVTGVASWDILDDTTVLDSLTTYGYAGHLDDPDAPANDLNFGAPEELFFILAGGDLSANQFNLYWSSYMAEITDKDSKLLTGTFRLKPSDIYTLDFSKFIHLDGNIYRLNKIEDYNMSKPDECKAELLKVNYLLY